eukprot:52848-Eustigmatos_ZCMA.PRE.1
MSPTAYLAPLVKATLPNENLYVAGHFRNGSAVKPAVAMAGMCMGRATAARHFALHCAPGSLSNTRSASSYDTLQQCN